jgi:hypothetical protein
MNLMVAVVVLPATAQKAQSFLKISTTDISFLVSSGLRIKVYLAIVNNIIQRSQFECVLVYVFSFVSFDVHTLAWPVSLSRFGLNLIVKKIYNHVFLISILFLLYSSCIIFSPGAEKLKQKMKKQHPANQSGHTDPYVADDNVEHRGTYTEPTPQSEHTGPYPVDYQQPRPKEGHSGPYPQ